jgi:hypothetical protein
MTQPTQATDPDASWPSDDSEVVCVGCDAPVPARVAKPDVDDTWICDRCSMDMDGEFEEEPPPNAFTRAYWWGRGLVARWRGNEFGQVGSIVLIGVLVVLAVVAGVLIFHAVGTSAAGTANCISNPSSPKCQSLP